MNAETQKFREDCVKSIASMRETIAASEWAGIPAEMIAPLREFIANREQMVRGIDAGTIRAERRAP